MKTKTILVTLAATLAFAATAQAKYYIPRHGARCKAHYVKRTVRIAKRHHGKVVRRHHKIVYVRQVRCVYVKPKTATTTKPPATLAAPSVVRADIDPSFTQDPADNLKVTWTYSASAAGSLPDGTLSLTVQEPNKAGSSGGCTMNVGGAVTGGTCTQELPHYGSWNVTVSYNGASSTVAPASQTETEDIEPLSSNPTPPVPTTTGLGLSYGTVYSETGPPPMDLVYHYGTAALSVSSSDPANDGFAVALVITNGPNSRTLAGSARGNACVLEFTRVDGQNVAPNTSVSGCGISGTELTSGDGLTVSVTTSGSAGYLGASSDAQAVTPPWALLGKGVAARR